MFFDKTRDDLRRDWLTAWQRHATQLPLTPLEAQLVDLIALHPEYHTWLERGDAVLQQEFSPEGGRINPFLHLSMHLSISEQCSIDQPRGIRQAVELLSHKKQSLHEAHHASMECLGRMIFESQRAGKMPDGNVYIDRGCSPNFGGQA
mgnify:CR=1 FL=1